MTYQLNHIDPDEIDRLRFKAFKTNDPYDTLAYYKAASAYFQDRHVREMNRADLATPLDDPRVEALVDLIKRAEHNVPEYYTLWHADARAALEAIASPSIATPLNDPRVKALVEALKEAERMLKHYGSRDAGGMAQIRAALSALEENR